LSYDTEAWELSSLDGAPAAAAADDDDDDDTRRRGGAAPQVARLDLVAADRKAMAAADRLPAADIMAGIRVYVGNYDPFRAI